MILHVKSKNVKLSESTMVGYKKLRDGGGGMGQRFKSTHLH